MTNESALQQLDVKTNENRLNQDTTLTQHVLGQSALEITRPLDPEVQATIDIATQRVDSLRSKIDRQNQTRSPLKIYLDALPRRLENM